jgi:hypothetical protein
LGHPSKREVIVMRMILRYENGRRVEAMLLAASAQEMRVAIDSRGDASVLVRAGDGWHGENGEAVEIEAMMAIRGDDVAAFCEGMRPRTLAAG